MIPRILLVGCGAVTQEAHAPALRRLEQTGEATVVGLCDPSADNARALQARFPQAQCFTSLEAVPPGFADVALVASPVRLHAAQTIHSLHAGLAVLCEKPMAGCSAETAAMLAAAAATGRLLAVGQVRRFYPACDFIRSVIADRRFGALRSFSIREGGRFGWGALSPSFFQKQTAGGGVLLDTGIHTLDLLLWWLGEPVTFDYADDRMGGLETTCLLRLDYGAFSGAVRLTRDYELPNLYRFDFEHAWIDWLPYAAKQLELGFRGSGRAISGDLLAVDEASALPAAARSGLPGSEHMFLRQWRNVLAAASGREPALVPGEAAALSLAFIERCYARRRFLEPGWLGSAELTRARELNRL